MNAIQFQGSSLHVEFIHIVSECDVYEAPFELHRGLIFSFRERRLLVGCLREFESLVSLLLILCSKFSTKESVPYSLFSLNLGNIKRV